MRGLPSSAGLQRGLAVCLLTLLLAAIASGCGEDGETTTASPTSTSEAKDEHRGGEKSIEDFGAEAGGSDRAAILADFHSYLRALAAKEFAKACRGLAAGVRRSLKRLVGGGPKAPGCTVVLPDLLAPTAPIIAREQANGEITKVRVEGGRAFVIFRAPGAKLYQLTMVREGGEWKAGLVAASVLVPDL